MLLFLVLLLLAAAARGFLVRRKDAEDNLLLVELFVEVLVELVEFGELLTSTCPELGLTKNLKL